MKDITKEIMENNKLEKIANTKVGTIDWKKVNRERIKQQKLYEISKHFLNKFGVCKLSLCDEHEQMQCERCKFETFLVEQIGNLIEEFYKYEDDKYGEQENIKM